MIVRRSVLVRLVAVSLLVAACSIAATAWITTRSTRAQLNGDRQRTLDADNDVYNRLVEYGRDQQTWDGVGDLISGLAPAGERTITLTDKDGNLIASNDPDRQHAPADVVPTALVDPLAKALVVPAAGTPLSGETLDPATEAVNEARAAGADAAPVPTVAPSDSASSSLRVVVPMLDTSLPDSVFALTPDEVGIRTLINDKMSRCTEGFDANAESAPGPYGGYVLQPTSGIPDGRYVKAVITCGGTYGDDPGAKYLQTNAALATAADTCLSAAGLRTIIVTNAQGVRGVGVPLTSAESAIAACRVQAVRSVLDGSVAPEALLYLSSPATPATRGWLSSAGGTRIVVALLLVLLVTLVAAALGARRLLHPIRSLTRAAQRMANGETQARVLVNGGDEIARLGAAFNTMAESVQSNERQRKQLVSDIAHELRTPLANVRGYLEGAQDDLVRLDDELVVSLLDETLQLQHLIDDLQDLALADAGQLRVHPEITDVTALVERVVAGQRPAADRAGITVTWEGGEPRRLVIDPVRIKQAVGNLITNAIRYTPRGGRVDVAVRQTVVRDAGGDDCDGVRIEVTDTGIGISDDDLPHLFDRFYRAETSRSRATGGSGLGLAVTRHLVEAHGGTIDVHSTVGCGSQFAIALPALVGAE